MSTNFKLQQIGVIRTPYVDTAPYQPVDEDEGEFRIVVDEKYADGLIDLKSFRYESGIIREQVCCPPQPYRH